MAGVPPFFTVPPEKNQYVPHVSAKAKFEFDAARIEYLKKWHPAVTLVVSRWSKAVGREHAEEMVDFLHEQSERVLLLGQPPELTIRRRFAIQHLGYLGVDPQKTPDYTLPRWDRKQFWLGKEIALRLAEKYSNVTFVPTEDLYMRGDEVLVLLGGHLVYYDGNHVSKFGSDLAKPRLRAAIEKALQRAD
jgi:hypothetical protein